MTREELVAELLPKNATKFERACAETILSRLDDLPQLIHTIWNPFGCPMELLPWLAWALSVDVWDDDWPEQIKRDVCAASPMVHRRKGTVAAVEAALTALKVRAEVTEWWQEVPVAERGTFKVTAYASAHIGSGNIVLSEAVQAQIMSMIHAAKPKSRPFQLQVGAEFGGGIGLATGLAGAQVHHREIDAGRNASMSTGLTVSTGLAGCTLTHKEIAAGRSGAMAAGLGIAGAMSGVQLTRFEFEASQ